MKSPRSTGKGSAKGAQRRRGAGPAGRLASVAGRFECEITLGRGDEWVSGSSVLSILCLAATQGTMLRVRAVGADAEQAVMEIGALIEAPDEDTPGA
mgnify:CR=1 FL=1